MRHKRRKPTEATFHLESVRLVKRLAKRLLKRVTEIERDLVRQERLNQPEPAEDPLVKTCACDGQIHPWSKLTCPPLAPRNRR